MPDALNAALRDVQRAKRIPSDARCGRCGIDEPRVLQEDGEGWICYACDLARRGRMPDEAHHVLGKAVDPTTVQTPANMHRVLSELQRGLPDDVRQAASRDPFAFALTLLGAIHDFSVAAVHFVGHVLSWLIRLWHVLRERFGPHWWQALDLPGLYATSED